MSRNYKAKDNNQFKIARDRMVSQQIEQRGIRNPRVLEAFRSVPRHLFMDEALWDQAYGDFPLPIGSGQTISQPYIVALMTQQLGLTGNERVLEIGTGSGYQTAILAELASVVYSVECVPSLLPRARNILEKLKYTNIKLKLDDGTWGWPSEAPFDAIMVTAGSPSVPQPIIDQLDDPGVLIIPVGDEYSQVLMKIINSQGKIHQEDLGGVRFVKLVGDHGWKKT